MKVCTMCEQELPLEAFHERTNKPGYYVPKCRDCLAQTRRFRRAVSVTEEPKAPWADHVATYGGAPTFDMKDAACKNYPHVSFFDKEHINWARSICDTCPIKAQCLEYAMSCYEIVGVWGGMNRDERFPTPKRPPRQRGLALERVKSGNKRSTTGYEWSATMRGYASLDDGSRLRCLRSTPVAALAGLLVKCAGIPTAEAEIRERLRIEMRGLRNAGLPKPIRNNVEAPMADMDVDYATSNMPSELRNVYSNWGE